LKRRKISKATLRNGRYHDSTARNFLNSPRQMSTLINDERWTCSYGVVRWRNYTRGRDKHWTGSGLLQTVLYLDWIRTVNHFKI